MLTPVRCENTWSLQGGHLGEFVTTLAGAKHRQKELATAYQWAQKGRLAILFSPEPDNSHDLNAVQVFAMQKGKSKPLVLGYLPADVAENNKERKKALHVVDAEFRESDEKFDFINLKLTIAYGNEGRSARSQTGASEKRLGLALFGAKAAISVGILWTIWEAADASGPNFQVVFGLAVCAAGLAWYVATKIRLRRVRRG